MKRIMFRLWVVATVTWVTIYTVWWYYMTCGLCGKPQFGLDQVIDQAWRHGNFGFALFWPVAVLGIGFALVWAFRTEVK